MGHYISNCGILIYSLPLYSIDNYSNAGYSQIITFEEAVRNIKERGLSDIVNLVYNDSQNALDDYDDYSIDCVFIDKDHSYDEVCRDLALWSRKIKKGGLLTGRKIHKSDSVKQAVDEFCSLKHYKYTVNQRSFWIRIDE